MSAREELLALIKKMNIVHYDDHKWRHISPSRLVSGSYDNAVWIQIPLCVKRRPPSVRLGCDYAATITQEHIQIFQIGTGRTKFSMCGRNSLNEKDILPSLNGRTSFCIVERLLLDETIKIQSEDGDSIEIVLDPAGILC